MNIKRKYLAVESTASFSFGTLIQKIKSELRNRFPELSSEDEEFSRLMLKNLKAFKLSDQSFDYTKQNNYLGGVRWFVLCPDCHKKSIKLYLPKDTSRVQKYLCKRCHQLKNTSALLGPTVRYQKVIRPLKQLEKIRKLLLKKNMTPEKAKFLLDAYDRIEEELKSSSEYRLWKFQQEHLASKSNLTPDPQ
jgi:hypothetical protein